MKMEGGPEKANYFRLSLLELLLFAQSTPFVLTAIIIFAVDLLKVEWLMEYLLERKLILGFGCAI